MEGADTTTESRTMASWPDGQTDGSLALQRAAIWLNELIALPPLMLSLTSHLPLWSSWADALDTILPVTAVEPSRYVATVLPPFFSGRTTGWFATSFSRGVSS